MRAPLPSVGCAPRVAGPPPGTTACTRECERMSLWTPGGEHEVPDDRPGGERAPTSRRPRRHRPRAAHRRAGPGSRPMAQEMAEVRAAAPAVPAATVVANHVMGLYELAAIHLSSQPPNLGEGRVAIDAMAGVVEALEGRLGENEPVLRDALAQLRLAFVQLPERRAERRPDDDADARPGATLDGLPAAEPARRRRRSAPRCRRRWCAMPSAMAVQWNGQAVPSSAVDLARARAVVERGDRASRRDGASQWTILESGSSMMSVAPASLSAGISMLIAGLRDHRLHRVAAVAEQLRHGRRLHRRDAGRSPRRGRPRPTLSFTSTLPRASSTPSRSVLSWCMAWRLVGVGVGRRGWRSARCSSA